jgi:hypothetical protein
MSEWLRSVYFLVMVAAGGSRLGAVRLSRVHSKLLLAA